MEATFHCALSGPFDNLFLARFSASRTLCEVIIAVISASTVYVLNFYAQLCYSYIIAQSKRIVKYLPDKFHGNQFLPIKTKEHV